MLEELPTEKDIHDLLAFLPLFDRPGRTFVKHWGGGEKMSDGAITMPYPVYDDDVNEFFRIAGQPCWMDRSYIPEIAGKMLADPQVVSMADIQNIRTMLTYCVRGERFCDGHRDSILRSGHLVALLKRLQQIQAAKRG